MQLTEDRTEALARLKKKMMKNDEGIAAVIDSLTVRFGINLIQHSDFRPELSAIRYICGVMSYNLSESR